MPENNPERTPETSLTLFGAPVQPTTPEAAAFCRLVELLNEGLSERLLTPRHYEILWHCAEAFIFNARQDRKGGHYAETKAITCL